MAKLSINYYLNDKLKATEIKDGAPAYRVYVRVIHKRVLSRLKSTAVNVPVTEKEFENLYNANIKRKIVTETEGIKLEKGTVSNSRETKTEYVTYDIKKHIADETKIIQSFFEFAENAISKDFVINKSKTDLGSMLNFFCNYQFFAVLESIETGFISNETRFENIYIKLRDYLTNEKGIPFDVVISILKGNIGVHSDGFSETAKYISLGNTERNYLHEIGVLTDFEAGKFEFLYLLQKYDYDTYRLPFQKKNERNPNPHEYLNFYVYLREKQSVLRYIKSKCQPYTAKYLYDLANEAEKIFVDMFKKGYFEGWKKRKQ